MPISMLFLPKLSRRVALVAAMLLGAALPVAGLSIGARAESKSAPPAELPQFNLNVAEIQVVPAYAPPADRAHIERSVPFSPLTALDAWAKTHVTAVGRQWIAVVIIRDASVTATPLKPKVDTIRDWFRRQPIERYDGALELELQIRDDAGRVRARTVARATHARYLMDDFRDRERERTQELQLLSDEIIAAALKQLDGEVRANLREWIRP